jgi:large subunit ribosomal protein L24
MVERIRTLLRRGDTVRVIAGRDRGKTGKILAVDRVRGRVTVERVNVVKKHTRANPARGIRGGVLEKEAPIHISNVMLVCPGCNRPTRLGRRQEPDGRRVRLCRRCGTVVDR